MLLFPEERHVQQWCGNWNQPRGYILTLEQMWRLAYAWYLDDRREPAWRRKTVTEAQAVFGQIGLTGEFWRL